MPEDKKTLDDKPTDDKPADAGGEPKKFDESGTFVHPETGEKYVPIGISRKWEGRAKDNYKAKQELDALKESQKSDGQKLTDKVTVAEKRATDAEAKATRYEVAAELGIHAKHLKYLTGSTEEEIKESGKGILDDFPETYGQSGTDADKKQPTRPKERLRSGAVPNEEPDETDPHKLAASVPRL